MSKDKKQKISSRTLKKQYRREMKQFKKANKSRAAYNQRPIVCPPDRTGMTPSVRILGYLCRMAVIFAAVFGLVFFMCDALRLEVQEMSISADFLAGVCLVWVALFSAMALHRYAAIGGGVLLVGGTAAYLATSGGIADFLVTLVMTVKNVVLTRLFKIGYYGFGSYITEISYSEARSAEYFLKVAFVIIAGLLAFTFVQTCLKRVRVLAPAIVSTLILGVVFTYNLSRSNWGVALIIASYTALIVMSVYDKIFTQQYDDTQVDGETVLFEDDVAPQMPEGVLSAEDARLLRKQKKKEFRELKKKHRKEKTQLTVEEELSDYFGSSVKAKKQKQSRPDGELTAEQKKQLKQENKLREAEIKRVADYRRAVADSRTAHGGFAAIGALVLALIIVLMPALTVKGNFSTIELIDEKMEEYRELVTAWLMGDDPILDDLGYKNDRNNFLPHSTNASPRYYTGELVMSVGVPYAANVYLRGWIATDYEDGAWLPADDEAFERYRQLYGTTIDPNELLFHYFYSLMDPEVVEEKDFVKQYNMKSRYAVIAMQVNIEREETEDSLVYMPSFYRVTDQMRAIRGESHGVLEHGTAQVMDDVTFVNYFDGLYTGRKFMSEMAYASVSYVPTMKVKNWYENVAELIAEFNAGYNDAYEQIEKYAERLEKGRTASINDVVEAIFTEQPEELVSVGTSPEGLKHLVVQYPRGQVTYLFDTAKGEMLSSAVTQLTEFTSIDPETGEVSVYTLAFAPPEPSLAIRFRELMTTEERRELAYAYYWQYLYESFVYETYSDDCDSDVIKDMLAHIIEENSHVIERVFNYDTSTYDEIDHGIDRERFALAPVRHSSDAATYTQRHELVMAIIDYLQEGYTYTLTPTAQAYAHLDGVENFLTVTKEGYCVQYASAVALMLREAGIPARYVEGYVACDFTRNYDRDAVSKYSTTVRDYNEHAWVEVWYDGVDWVQYETTPVYYGDMYVKGGEAADGTVVRPWYDSEDEMTEEQELLESICSSLDFAESTAEGLREELRLLVGGKKIKQALDNIEATIAEYREYYRIQSEFYAANGQLQDYDSADFIPVLINLSEKIEEKINQPLYLQITLIDSLRGFNNTLRIAAVAAVALAALILLVVWAGRRAAGVEKKRIERIKSMANGATSPDKLRDEAGQLSRWLSALLAAYGSAPKVGEFRDEYAARLESQYLDTFGKLRRIDPESSDSAAELVSDTDFGVIFDAVAAEEFGNGMTAQQLETVAAFYLRLRGAAARKMPRRARIYYHYIKRLI